MRLKRTVITANSIQAVFLSQVSQPITILNNESNSTSSALFYKQLIIVRLRKSFYSNPKQITVCMHYDHRIDMLGYAAVVISNS
jgi:hypothetical protein